MSAEKKNEAAGSTETTTVEGEKSLLAEIIDLQPLATTERTTELVKTLIDEVLGGTIAIGKDFTKDIQKTIDKIDEKVSKQLAAIMHKEEFQTLEGSWRGMFYLVMNSETGTQLKLRVLNCSKRVLQQDLEKAVEFDQSTLFKKIYESEFGMPGGTPYGAMIGDYEFKNHPDDIGMLKNLSSVAAAAFCPLISAASPNLFNLKNWTDLSQPRDLKKIFDTVEHTQWQSFRESEDSRFVTLTLPRTLARLPYGRNTKPIDEFSFEEVDLGKDGKPKVVDHTNYCWMNTAYVFGARLTDAFAQTGFCTAIRGFENGGKVEGLPAHVFRSDDGDLDLKCPTEVAITDRREKEISDLGFLPLSHYKEKDYAVFFGAQTTQKPKIYNQADATSNAAISARLPYIMATSRIAHFLKVMARDKIGSAMEVADCQKWLNNWIMDYVIESPTSTGDERARRPLREAKIQVTEIPGKPGSYNAIAHLRPWLQLEELTASLRLVAEIPKLGG